MPECTLAPHVDDFVKKSHSFTLSIRKLRKEFAKCSHCDQYPDCILRLSFQDRIRTAVSELSEEWNLSESF